MTGSDTVTPLRQGVAVCCTDLLKNKIALNPDGTQIPALRDRHSANLFGANLVRANLSAAILMGTNLSHANLNGANLSAANLLYANLDDAYLSGANLSGANLDDAYLSSANLSGANLGEAHLSGANLSGAKLIRAHLSGADLSRADLSGADLSSANLSKADVTHIKWDRAQRRGKYGGIRGIDSCWGSPLFKRDAADQAFLDALEEKWKPTWRRWLFRAWGLIDYGRSLRRVAALGSGLAILYGFGYWIAWWWGKTLLCYPLSANNWFGPFYFSIVTFTTLGFGDVKPNGVLGEMLTSSEVIFGYITLGLLLAVLAEKIARRA